ncbi:MAG: Gfo/Idh/MocA family oxidoreductase [Blastochloris sp.]|nr:Gfo/Idh/MocA family oxidoreductase [Blastochloris sp.]
MKKTSRPKKRVSVRLAIIGTGGMANQHAKKFKEIAGCELVAAADVDPLRVQDFCAKHGIPKAYTDLSLLLKTEQVDAVSIVTPDVFHAPLSIQCLKAGKHVLCEKPLALNYEDAHKMVLAARKSGVMHMVNFSYRDWPCIQAVAELVKKGVLGDLRHVEASYYQSWLSSKVWGDWRSSSGWLWRLSKKHGSHGVLGDVGVHIVDFATFPAGPLAAVLCRLKTFAKAPRNRVGEYVLDANDSAVMLVEYQNGALGTIQTTRWASGHANRLYLKIAGTLGAVEIDSERSTTGYRLCAGPDLDKAQWQSMEAPATPDNYARFIRAIQTGRAEPPDFVRGAEVQKVLDACLESDAKGAWVKV